MDITGAFLGGAPRPGMERDFVREDLGFAPPPGLLQLSTAQRMLWTGQKLSPGSPMYNMAVALTLDTPLDVDRFRRALQTLVERCDALRTSFEEIDGRVGRRVADRVQSAMDFHDLSGEADAVTRGQLGTHLETRTTSLFNLEGPLFDTALFKLAERRFVWYLNQHHLITDAWSTSLLVTRLGRLYAADGTQDEDTNNPSPDYEAFLNYEQSTAGTTYRDRADAYWRRQADVSQPAHGRPRTQSFYGRTASGHSGRSTRHSLSVGGRSNAIRALAKRSEFRALSDDMSLFHVFATVLCAYLSRVGDTDQPQLSAPSHNRATRLLKETPGVLIELFPLAITVKPDDTFLSLAQSVGRANQARLVHAVTGTSSLAPASAVILNFIKGTLGPFGDIATTVDWIHSGWVDPGHALRLQVHDFDGTGEFRVELDLLNEVFGAPESRWALRHLLQLLDACLADPAQRVSFPELTTPNEPRLSVPAAEPRVATATAPSVTDLFETQAARTPAAVAVRDHDSDRALTYQQLLAQVDALAVGIRRHADNRHRRIGVCLPRSRELVVAVLAALKANTTFVPLDPSYPAQRGRFIVTDAELTTVLTTSALATQVAKWGAIPVDLNTSAPSDAGSAMVPPGNDPPAPAYVLYTSGSTGHPKGVVIPQAALANYVHWASGQYTARSPTDFALFTSLTFDLTLTSLLVPVVCGGAVVAYGDNGTDNGFLVRQVFADDNVDVVKLTPSHLALARDLLSGCTRIRTLVLGGEDLPTELARAALDALPEGATVFNEYGPTEATVGCTVHRFDPLHDRRMSVPIGRPIQRVRVSVLDPHGRPCPRGVNGEIAVTGVGLARGYLNRGELTRRRLSTTDLPPTALCI